MTAALLAFLASVGTTTAVGAVGLGRPPDPLASTAIVRVGAFGIRDVLAIAGGWPILRRVRLSRTTTTRLGLSRTGWNERQVAAAKALFASTSMLVGSVMVGPMLGVPVALLAWRVPDVVVARLVRRTMRAADREIPVLLDLLAVATSAGLPQQLAFRRAVEAATGPWPRSSGP